MLLQQSPPTPPPSRFGLLSTVTQTFQLVKTRLAAEGIGQWTYGKSAESEDVCQCDSSTGQEVLRGGGGGCLGGGCTQGLEPFAKSAERHFPLDYTT